MRTSLVALATCSLIAAASAVASTPAEAAAGCRGPATVVSSTVSPRTVVLGTSDNQGIVLTAKIRSNGCRIDRVEMGVYGPNVIDSFDLERGETKDGVTTYDTGVRIAPGSLPNSEAGRWQTFISVWGESQPNVAGPDFTVQRAARVSTNASPEPVRKGRTITVKGTLARADWEALRYRGYGKRTVELQWRSPTGAYRTVKTVTASSTGALRTTVKASTDGCFRYVFRGSAATARAVSAGDCVDVR
jgi:hypothetical protein